LFGRISLPFGPSPPLGGFAPQHPPCARWDLPFRRFSLPFSVALPLPPPLPLSSSSPLRTFNFQHSLLQLQAASSTTIDRSIQFTSIANLHSFLSILDPRSSVLTLHAPSNTHTVLPSQNPKPNKKVNICASNSTFHNDVRASHLPFNHFNQRTEYYTQLFIISNYRS
jgi:hypothetical protein